MTTARGVSKDDRVVLFDGVCRLCNAWSRFLIRFDLKKKFKLVSVQSPEGQRLLRSLGLPTDTFDTMVLIERKRAYTQSAAFIRVMARLPFPWPAFVIAWLIPRFARNWLYDRIARNRYALFGRHDVCILPAADHKGRFLDDHAK